MNRNSISVLKTASLLIVIISVICVFPVKTYAVDNSISGWDVLYTTADDTAYFTKEIATNYLHAYQPFTYVFDTAIDQVANLGYIDEPDKDLNDFGTAFVRASITDNIIDALGPDDTLDTKAQDIVDCIVSSSTALFSFDGYQDVDGDLQCFINTMDALSNLSGLSEKGGFSFASKCAGAAAALGNFITSSSQYKEMKAQYKTKKEFNEAFWKMSLEGVWDCLKDLPRELRMMCGDISRSAYGAKISPYEYRYNACNSWVIISTATGFNPYKPHIIAGVEGDANVKVIWGDDISDFDIWYDMQ